MYNTNLLRRSMPTLVAAIDNTIDYYIVTGYDVSPYACASASTSASTSTTTQITLWCKNIDKVHVFRVYISGIGEIFTPYDALYPLIKAWLSDVSSRERQCDRNNQIRDELMKKVTLKFEPMPAF